MANAPRTAEEMARRKALDVVLAEWEATFGPVDEGAVDAMITHYRL